MTNEVLFMISSVYCTVLCTVSIAQCSALPSALLCARIRSARVQGYPTAEYADIACAAYPAGMAESVVHCRECHLVIGHSTFSVLLAACLRLHFCMSASFLTYEIRLLRYLYSLLQNLCEECVSFHKRSNRSKDHMLALLESRSGGRHHAGSILLNDVYTLTRKA